MNTSDGGAGGGLFCGGYGSKLTNVKILNCSAASLGGGARIGCVSGAATIDGMVVSNCTLVGTSSNARMGAGLWISGENSEGSRVQASNVVIGNCHVLNLSDKNVQGAGLYVAKSDCRNFTISDCSIVDNELTAIPTTVFMGGGAYLNDASLYDSVVTNCVLSRQNNTRQGSSNGKADGERGGGVYAAWNNNVPEEYRTIISNCVITCCAATNDYNGIGQGGGVYLAGPQTGGGPLLCDSLITGNRAGALGAGAFVAQNMKATIARCEFSDNAIDPKSYQKTSETNLADINGGGTAIASLGAVDIAGCRIKGNRGTVPGSNTTRHNSAVRLQGSASTMTDCDLDGNYGYQCGAALSLGALNGLVVSNCVFHGNSCEERGGVLYTDSMSAGDTLITDCYIMGNTSTKNLIGFAPTANGGANACLRNSLITDNDCTGVIYYNCGTTDLSVHMTVENCTVVSNRCSDFTFTSNAANPMGLAFVDSVILFNKKANGWDFLDKMTNMSYCCASQFRSPVDASNIVYDSSKPLFEDMANGNFRPAKRSQLRDVVSAAAWMGDGSKKSTLDMGTGYEVASVGKYGVTVNRVNAVPRLYGGVADIGCCEYWQQSSGFILFVR